MNGLALVIGNANYLLEENRLLNAVNDAKDVAAKLQRLGFVVIRKIDSIQTEFDEAATEFQNELIKYDVGLFYYCGHGLQIDGINYVTSTDTNFWDEYTVTRNTTKLEEIIDRMHKSDVKTKIVVLDACRDNPLRAKRGIPSPGLAPIHAPSGTIIAFSTSPGETASDGGSGRNSVYTGAFLNHIEDPDIPIEELFKRVRHSVYALTNGRQTTWEHTSLIGEYYFNSGQMTHSVDIPYLENHVADSQFVSSGSEFDKIIEGLKSYVYDTQNKTLSAIRGISADDIAPSQQFLLGRNILQVSCDGAFNAEKIIKNLPPWLDRFFIGAENHVLNGMLYEMYFDSHGKFRGEKIKNAKMEEVLALQGNIKFKSSFDFISKHLRPFKRNLFFIPSSSPKSVAVEILFEKISLGGFKRNSKGYRVSAITFKGTQVYQPNQDDYPSIITYAEFKSKVQSLFSVPSKYLTLSTNIDLSDESLISFPYHFVVKLD